MKYVCTVCGYVFDEEKEGKSFAELTECPICMQPASVFKPEEGQEAPQAPAAEAAESKPANPLAYDPAFARIDESCRYMKEIHEVAVSGKTIGAAMSTKMPMAGWDDVLLMGAELDSPNAQAYLDRVRSRAGLQSVPATLDNIKKERRFELAFEGVRYYDLLR